MRKGNIIKTLIITFILFLAYLFVLNGRYTKIDKGYLIFDKWRCRVIKVPELIDSNK